MGFSTESEGTMGTEEFLAEAESPAPAPLAAAMGPILGDLYCWGKTPLVTPTVEAVRGDKLHGITSATYSMAALMDSGVKVLEGPADPEVMEALPEDVDAAVYGDGFAVFKTREGQLLSCGSGQEGQLGLGGKCLECTLPRPLRSLDGHVVLKVSAGASHVAALTTIGDVFTWGRGFEGQLGLWSKVQPEELNRALFSLALQPKIVAGVGLANAVDVACGLKHTAVVTKSGEVLTFGEGLLGQLGHGRVTGSGIPRQALPREHGAYPKAGGGGEGEEAPETADAPDPFVEVACGWGHTLCRTRAGRLWAFGFNSHGQLGLGDRDIRYFPERITGGLLAAEDATQIAASGNVSACVLSPSMRLATWGTNAEGQQDGPVVAPAPEEEEEEEEGAAPAAAGTPGCVTVPRLVPKLARKRVSHVACRPGSVYAHTPTVVYDISPKSGSVAGNTYMRVSGSGFWASDDIVIRFTPVDTSVPARAAIGTYAGEKDGIQEISVVFPKFSKCVNVTVEVSMNGRDFTSDGNIYGTYEVPEILSLSPPMMRRGGAIALALPAPAEGDEAPEAEPAPFVEITAKKVPPEPEKLLVKFKEVRLLARENAGPARACVMPGRLHFEGFEDFIDDAGSLSAASAASSASGINPTIRCAPPDFGEGDYPVTCRVFVSFNGKDFNVVPNAIFTLQDLRLTQVEPVLQPLTDALTFAAVGHSILATEGEDAVNPKSLAGGVVSAAAIEAKILVGPALLEQSEDAGVVPCLACECLGVDTSHLQLTLPSAKLPAGVSAGPGELLPAAVQVKVAGEGWGAPVPFNFYTWPSATVAPASGPLGGGTRLTLRVRDSGWAALSSCALVRLESADPTNAFCLDVDVTDQVAAYLNPKPAASGEAPVEGADGGEAEAEGEAGEGQEDAEAGASEGVTGDAAPKAMEQEAEPAPQEGEEESERWVDIIVDMPSYAELSLEEEAEPEAAADGEAAEPEAPADGEAAEPEAPADGEAEEVEAAEEPPAEDGADDAAEGEAEEGPVEEEEEEEEASPEVDLGALLRDAEKPKVGIKLSLSIDGMHFSPAQMDFTYYPPSYLPAAALADAAPGAGDDAVLRGLNMEPTPQLVLRLKNAALGIDEEVEARAYEAGEDDLEGSAELEESVESASPSSACVITIPEGVTDLLGEDYEDESLPLEVHLSRNGVDFQNLGQLQVQLTAKGKKKK